MNYLFGILAAPLLIAACVGYPAAQDRADQAHDAMIAEHKLDIADSKAAKQQAADDYYQSEQYRQARHANDFLAKNRGDL